jgi:hypothetical protein
MKEYLTAEELKKIQDRVQVVKDRLKEINLKQQEARERTKFKSNHSLPEELGSNPEQE